MVNIGRNTNMEITLQPAVIQGETVNVVADATPLIDKYETGNKTTVTLIDLEKTSTARDPGPCWRPTLGVPTDRINVGGNESGQRWRATSPGSAGDQAVWSVDGMVITDMTASAAPPPTTISTPSRNAGDDGGSTPRSPPAAWPATWSPAGAPTSGAAPPATTSTKVVNRRGTSTSANPTSASPAPGTTTPPDRLQPGEPDRQEPGVRRRARRPIVKDHLLGLGLYARQEVDLLTIDNFSDKTTLKD